jgi:hypothetical protein
MQCLLYRLTNINLLDPDFYVKLLEIVCYIH